MRSTSATAPIADALWVGFSHEHPGIRRAFCASGHTKDLYQDYRKRQQTPPRLLRHLRHPDLCLRSGQSADLRVARRYDHPARRLRPAAADLAAVCTALGGRSPPSRRPRRAKQLHFQKSGNNDGRTSDPSCDCCRCPCHRRNCEPGLPPLRRSDRQVAGADA